MLFHQALGQVIRETRLSQNKSMRQMTQFISLGHLSDIERGRKELSSHLLPIVAKGLGIEAHDLIIQAGFRMAGWHIPDNAKELLELTELVSR